MSTSQKIFKFLSVRGIELGKKNNDFSLLFRYESQNNELSDFVKNLQKQPAEQKKEIATKFLSSKLEEDLFYNKNLYDFYEYLSNLCHQFEKQGNEFTDEQHKEFTQKAKAVKSKINKTIVQDHWDLLIASSLNPTLYNSDRAKIIYPLRIINILKNANNELKDISNLKAFLKAVPVIPKDLVFKAKPNKTKPEVPQKPKDDIAGKKVEIYNKALEELEFLDRQNSREIAKLDKQKTAPKLKTKGNLKTNEEAVFDKEQIGVNPFVFLPPIAKSITPETKLILKELKLTSEDRVSLIIDRVEKKQQENIVDANKGKGVKSILSSVGNFSSIPLDMSSDYYLNPDKLVSGIGSTVSSVASVPSSRGSVKPIGIGDLILVEEELIKYSTHEIAHVENILQSEFKERVHRRLEQEEESYLFESESTSETENDLQKAERYELQKESESVISFDQSANAGVSVSAGYGPVSVSANASYSVSNSFQNSISNATTYARDVTERSVNKIIERTLEQSSSKSLTEVEETNTHGFDNKEGTGHVIGIYRYLQKVYKAQMYNYGKRLMFEFMVPEPAAFYKYSLTNQILPGMTLSMPDDEILDLSPSDISRTSYLALVKLYQAQGVLPPPSEYVYIAKAIYQDYNAESRYTGAADNEMQVPEGYFSDSYNVDRAYGIVESDKALFQIVVGDRKTGNLRDGDIQGNNLSELTGSVPVVIKTSYLTNWGVTIEVKCKLSSEKFQEWQVDTYGALLDAYNNLKQAYEDQLAAAKSSAGVGEFGQSDEMNRILESVELKRSCISLLTDQHFDLFDAMEYPSSGSPEMDIDEAMIEGKYVQFFEQAFEWENTTYTFYPYFWSNKSKWIENLNIQNRDIKFQDFLKAGYARTLVPVRPGYDEAVLHYLETGEIWEGGEVPAIDDEMYVSIIEELYDGHDTEKEAIGESWELTVPTNLVYLQPDAELPNFEEED